MELQPRTVNRQRAHCAAGFFASAVIGASFAAHATQQCRNRTELRLQVVRETFTRDGRRYEIEYRALSETEYDISGMTPRSTKTFDGQ